MKHLNYFGVLDSADNIKKMVTFMKKTLFALLFIAVVVSCNAQDPKELAEQNGKIDSTLVVQPEGMHPKIDLVVMGLLNRYHYKKTDLNDSLSSVIYDNFVKSLDFNKLYFLQSDIDEFEMHRDKMDDYLKTGQLKIAYDIFNRFKTRMSDRIKYINKRLETEFDYTIDEFYIPDREKAEWAKTNSELDEIWRKRLKSDALNKALSKEEWEKISKTLLKRYHDFHKIILQYKSEEVFQLYLNAFTEAIDPHTSYFSPITSENFDISMKLSLEGIGAQLRTIDDYTTIVRIIPGGPAAKSENLFEDDRIVAVGQGEDGEMIDVVGWRIDDVVQLIRGKKGTLVRLAILRKDDTPDMPTEEIQLVRDKIKLEEQASSSEIIDIEQGGKTVRLGVIDIPTFYIDFEAQRKGDPDYKSTTRDVRKLIAELQEKKVDGIVIDLRNNGGGALQEAIELTGLFIKYGPVVQIRNSNGYIEEGKDPDPALVYDGPLAVMINRYSASASEIFSGAIQDYGRGLIIGEQTFGKGTVQNLIDLNRFILSKDKKLGRVKLTISKFYRVTGSSTQKLGVIPDIEFPSLPRDDFGEAARPSALKWDQIQAADFIPYGDLSSYIPELRKSHEERIAHNMEFQFIKEDIEEYLDRKEKKTFSLNIEKRKAEREKNKAKKDEREAKRNEQATLKLKDKKEVETGEDKEIDDPYLQEGGHILAEMILKSVG